MFRARTARSARELLYALVDEWEEQRTDPRDLTPYRALLEELLFHSELRYNDYIQFREDGAYPARLLRVLQRLGEQRLQQTMLELACALTFVDRGQMLALHRDAYRRVIAPWIAERHLVPSDDFRSDYHDRILDHLRSYPLLSITESFGFGEFLHVNSLAGLEKPRILGEDLGAIPSLLPRWRKSHRGVIVLEDFVGTGKQASGVLSEIRRCLPRGFRILFVPLIILKGGLVYLRHHHSQRVVKTRPVLTVPQSSCVTNAPTPNDPAEFTRFRGLVRRTAARVMVRGGVNDDAPEDPFGYKGSGALLVTAYNTPNNTLPLIHHQAPDWQPLFRRLHHRKDALR